VVYKAANFLRHNWRTLGWILGLGVKKYFLSFPPPIKVKIQRTGLITDQSENPENRTNHRPSEYQKNRTIVFKLTVS
jgi:hypothetical protein